MVQEIEKKSAYFRAGTSFAVKMKSDSKIFCQKRNMIAGLSLPLQDRLFRNYIYKPNK